MQLRAYVIKWIKTDELQISSNSVYYDTDTVSVVGDLKAAVTETAERAFAVLTTPVLAH